MKKILFITLAITLSLLHINCKSSYNKTERKKIPLEGLWLGYYSVDGNNTVGKQYGNLIIKPDGTLIYDSDGGGTQHLTIGTWTLKDNLLTCDCKCVYGLESNRGTKQIFTFHYNETTGVLSKGVWKDKYDSGSGTFTLTRVK